MVLSGAQLTSVAVGQVVGANTNAIGPTPDDPSPSIQYYPDTLLRQQNEPSCGVQPENPLVILCGYNDYRGIKTELDTWQGLSMSRDGGLTWTSRLAPGFRGSSSSLDLGFAADPGVATVPGLGFLNFIAGNREGQGDKNAGGIYLQRLAAPNKEDGFPYVPEKQVRVIQKGSSGRFIDKPYFFATLSPNDGVTPVSMELEDGTQYRVDAPAGSIHLAYAIFVGNENNDSSKIVYARSDDYGLTWSPETKLTESLGINSGIYVASMRSGDTETLMAVWRRRFDNNEKNSILYSISNNNGRTWSSPAVLADLCPFDQGTGSYSFRTNAFPVIASDGQSFYAFWADRRTQSELNSAAACPTVDTNPRTTVSGPLSRVVMSRFSSNKWSTPTQVDPNAPGGHQFMPAAYGASGLIQVIWYDSRDTAAQKATGLSYLRDTPFIADRPYCKGDASLPLPCPNGTMLARHTLDVRGRQVIGGTAVGSGSFQISSYRVGLAPQFNSPPPYPGQLIQLERNFANARMFKQGKAPFNGDYVWVGARPFRLQNGAWVPNQTAPQTGSIDTFYTAWSDSRNARGNTFGAVDENASTPTTPATAVGETGAEVLGQCVPTLPTQPASPPSDRTRDQNIYTAAIRPSATFTVASVSKPAANVQRVFVLSLLNLERGKPRPLPATFNLEIVNTPTGVLASFDQERNVQSIEVVIEPGSRAARPVFVSVTGSTSSKPQVLVRATRLGPPDRTVGTVALNSNAPSFPEVIDPDYDGITSVDPAANPPVTDEETHDPLLVQATTSTKLTCRTGCGATAPYVIENPDIENPDIENPDIENPDIENPDIENPDIENPDIENPDIENPDIENPDIENPDIENPDIENPDIENAAFLDFTTVHYTVKNTGNTTTPYTIKPLVAGPRPELTNSETGEKFATPQQLLVFKPYTVPNSYNCNTNPTDGTTLSPYVAQNQVLVNDHNPDSYCPEGVADPSRENYAKCLEKPDLTGTGAGKDAPTFYLAPGEELRIAYRVYDPTFDPRRVGMAVHSTACNTTDGERGVNSAGIDKCAITASTCVNEDGSPCSIAFEVDEEAPVFVPNQPPLSDVGPVEATSPDGVVVPLDPEATDNWDPDVDVVCVRGDDATKTLQDPFPIGTTSVTCTATDDFGNKTTDGFTVTVADTTKPAFEGIPADVTAEATSDAGAVVNYTEPTATDLGKPVDVGCTPASGSTFAIGETVVTCTADDKRGNVATATFKVTVTDTTGPVITGLPPADIPSGPIEATSPDGAIVNYTTPTATDLGEPLPVTCDKASGSLFPIATTTVTCSVTDSSQNTSSGSFDVTVTDSTKPVISDVPSDIVAEATSPAGAVVNYTSPTATDLGQPIAVQCTPASGSTFALGDTTVECSATDGTGNEATASFKVTVQDTTAPTFSNVPADATFEATSPTGYQYDYVPPTASDLGEPVEVACSPASGSTFPIGATTVNCSANDGRGNTGVAAFTVTVRDTAGPVFSNVPADIVQEATGPTGAKVTYTSPTATDLGQAATVVCSPASGSTFALGTTTVTCSASDGSGNTSTATFKVTVRDTTAPVFRAVSDVTVNASGSSIVVNYTTPIADDLVSGAITGTCTPASGSSFTTGTTTTVNCSAKDAAGNTATTSFKVIVNQANYAGFWSQITKSTVKAGSSVPIDWAFLDANGARVDSPNARPTVRITAASGNCSNLAIAFDPGNSNFRYSSSSRQWQYNWQTKGCATGTPHTVTIYSDLTKQSFEVPTTVTFTK